MIDRNKPIAVHQLMLHFEKGEMTMLQYVSDEIDLAIDHYQDATDTHWQRCKNKHEFLELLNRLGSEVFPKGTTIIELESIALEDGWFNSRLVQEFWYGLEDRMVRGQSIIISHEVNGEVDYFREFVQSVTPLDPTHSATLEHSAALADSA